MKRKVITYALLIFAIFASFSLLVGLYIVKTQFVIKNGAPTRAERVKIENGKMLIETDMNGFNERISSFCAENISPPENIALNDMAYIFKEMSESGRDELFLNVTGAFNIPYSFKCYVNIDLEDGIAGVAVTDVLLGTYEIPYIGSFIWRLLELPMEMSFPLKKEEELRYLSAIEAKPDGTVILAYDYNAEELSKVFGEILHYADERKINFHRGEGTVDENILNMAGSKSASPEEAMEMVLEFEKSPDSFLELCYILSDDGILKLYSLFGEDYYKHVDAEKLVAASENEIDSGLNDFHKNFSRQLLQHLYRNPDYVVYDGLLYHNDDEITPETVMRGVEDAIYEMELHADENSILSKYSYDEHKTDKIIINEITQ